jgi:hypothetical protein
VIFALAPISSAFNDDIVYLLKMIQFFFGQAKDPELNLDALNY